MCLKRLVARWKMRVILVTLRCVPIRSVLLHEVRLAKMAAHPHQGSGPSAPHVTNVVFPQQPGVSTMDADPRQLKGRNGALSALNTAIEAMNLAKEVSSVTPAKAVFGSVSVLLTMIRVRFLFSPR